MPSARKLSSCCGPILRNGTSAIRLAEPLTGLVLVEPPFFLVFPLKFNDNVSPIIAKVAKPTISVFLLLAYFFEDERGVMRGH